MKRQTVESQFVVCMDHTGYAASLELRKIYRAVSDPQAARRKHLRVIDESGEDYLYPASCFAPIEVPPRLEKALLHAS